MSFVERRISIMPACQIDNAKETVAKETAMNRLSPGSSALATQRQGAAVFDPTSSFIIRPFVNSILDRSRQCI
ncbi:unnamed protein product [Soboliphyme baturini]|uniref:Uncharacterized protein n=1 Tax=Soboliphyme baturini TaxID=241478 RepID=A0A183IUP2_9BILA|nr:unnamed protein product [Soboliphyme baturini]